MTMTRRDFLGTAATTVPLARAGTQSSSIKIGAMSDEFGVCAKRWEAAAIVAVELGIDDRRRPGRDIPIQIISTTPGIRPIRRQSGAPMDRARGGGYDNRSPEHHSVPASPGFATSWTNSTSIPPEFPRTSLDQNARQPPFTGPWTPRCLLVRSAGLWSKWGREDGTLSLQNMRSATASNRRISDSVIQVAERDRATCWCL